MKRFSVIFVVLALCLSLCACGGPSPTYRNGTLFERVQVFDDCSIYRHKDTNVLYVYSGSGFTVMLNPDGTPQTWKGY